MKHFFLLKSGMRDTNNVQRKEKRKKKKLLLLGLEPTPLSYNAVDSSSSLFEYSSKWR
jgi:hypothetical protein